MTNEQINYRLENYLRELDKSLAQIPMAERSDIILELNGHITESLKTKSIDEILNALGKPEQVANRYLLERGLQPIPKNRGGCFKWGCLGVVAFFLVLILSIVLLVRSFFPLVEVNEENERVRILGGMIDVDGEKGKVDFKFDIGDGADSTPMITKEFPVGDFSKIKLDCGGDVEVTQGQKNSVVVQTTTKNMEWIDVKTEGQTLILGTKRDGVFRFDVRKLKFIVTLKDLNQAFIDGSGDVHIKPLNTTSLDLQIDGAGDFHVEDLKANSLSLRIDGAGDATVSGQVSEETIVIDGAGDFKGRGLLAQKAHVEIDGAGDARLWVNQSLSATVNGSGDVRYVGSPHVTKDVNGSGSVEALE